MKLQFIILFTLVALVSKSQVLPDSVIRKNNISRVTEKNVSKTKTGIQTSYTTLNTATEYNKSGKPIKSTRCSYDPLYKYRDSSIIEYFYRDALVSSTKWKEYENGKLTDKGSEKYTYIFDSINRMASRLVTDDRGRKTKEEYVWNTSNKIQETRYYSNDSAVYVPQRSGYDFVLGKNLQLNKVVGNYWSRENKLLKSVECKPGCKLKYINDSLCCTSTVYSSYKDTLIQKISFYNEGWQTVTEKRYTMPSGAIYEESQRGDKSLLFEQKNSKGLVVKKEIYEIEIEGCVSERTTTYGYRYYSR